MTLTFLGSLVFSLVFVAIHLLRDAIMATTFAAAARPAAVGLAFLLVAYLLGTGKLG